MTEKELENLIARALEEDIPQGDITSESIIPEDSFSKAQILAKEEGILAGLDVALMVFQYIDPSIYFEKRFKDGDKFKKGDVLAILEGKTISILKGERVALNFLQRLSGIATLTNKFVEGVKGYNTDAYGFRKSITPFLKEQHTKALIFGTGGASKAVAFVFKELNIPYTFVSRKPTESQLSYQDLNTIIFKEYTILVNCTPLGAYPNIDLKPDIQYRYITPEHLLFDLIYNPEKTAFLQEGEKQGAAICNGQRMLELQAEKAWKIWNS